MGKICPFQLLSISYTSTQFSAFPCWFPGAGGRQELFKSSQKVKKNLAGYKGSYPAWFSCPLCFQDRTVADARLELPLAQAHPEVAAWWMPFIRKHL